MMPMKIDDLPLKDAEISIVMLAYRSVYHLLYPVASGERFGAMGGPGELRILSFPTTWKLLLLVEIMGLWLLYVVIIVFGFCYFLLIISLLWLILIIAMYNVWWNLWKPWLRLRSHQT